MSRSPHKQRSEKAPSEDDVWLAATNEKCARAMARWLKGTINIRRTIDSLTLEEMKALAGVAWSTMIVEISKRAAVAPESDAALITEMYLG
jgi:hypothetical protein